MNERRTKYLQEMAALWDVLAEHPSWTTRYAIRNTPSLQHLDGYVNRSPVCKYAFGVRGVDCDKCAIEEWRTILCRCFDAGPFVEWVNAETH